MIIQRWFSEDVMRVDWHQVDSSDHLIRVNPWFSKCKDPESRLNGVFDGWVNKDGNMLS